MTAVLVCEFRRHDEPPDEDEPIASVELPVVPDVNDFVRIDGMSYRVVRRRWSMERDWALQDGRRVRADRVRTLYCTLWVAPDPREGLE